VLEHDEIEQLVGADNQFLVNLLDFARQVENFLESYWSKIDGYSKSSGDQSLYKMF
jgi:hypothetical protein